MHLIWLTPEFPSSKDNTKGIYIYRTVKELAKFYKITVIALYPAAPPILEIFKYKKDWKNLIKDWKTNYTANNSIQILNCDIIYLRYYRLPRKLFHDVEGWFAYWQIRKKLKNIVTKDSIIHANWIFPAGTLGKIISKKYKVPFLISLLGSDVNRLVVGTKFWKSAQKLFNDSNNITAVTNDLFEKCEKKNIHIEESKKYLIDNIYESDKFYIKDRIETRKMLGIDDNSKIIFYAGNLIPLKNVDILINAYSLIENKYSDTLLFIAGAGGEEGSLKRLSSTLNLNNKIFFLGPLLGDDLVNYYNAADLLSLQSKSEGLPNVIVESFLCGTPVVATDVGGISKIVKEGSNGFLVKPNSIEDLAQKIEQCLANAWNRNEIRNSISDLFPQKVIEKYHQLYNKLV
ncbi:MAG: glycosyltransferase [Ignavibacteriae bacterium]|nr:glycosyltransferase [Ignavibacteriota bacterium]